MQYRTNPRNGDALSALGFGCMRFTKRGSAIDQSALRELMTGSHLSGAALDVFEVEPLPPEDALWDCPRRLITPHCSGNMTLGYTVDRIVALFLEDFENYCAGKPLERLVDLQLGY